MKDDILYDYWWASQEDNFCKPLKNIVEQAGSARNLYYMDKEELAAIKGVSSKYAELIADRKSKWNLELEYQKCLNLGVVFIPFYSDIFPDKLRRITSCPFGIFVKGSLPDKDVKSVAIIGARDCSQYGREVARELGISMAEYGIQVISGMAYGIDGIAQMSVLDAGGRSFGVLGSGVDICYPRTNIKLYERLIDNGGVISEYGIGTRAQSRLFPPRNRIIAALSDLIVVVEAKDRSGTLITVDMALDQGKDVAVVPGRITDELSIGCNKLLKMGAFPVCSGEDIMRILNPSFEAITNNEIETVVLSSEEKEIYKMLDFSPVSVETLTANSSIKKEHIIHVLLSLEIQGYVMEIAKDKYVITRKIRLA